MTNQQTKRITDALNSDIGHLLTQTQPGRLSVLGALKIKEADAIHRTMTRLGFKPTGKARRWNNGEHSHDHYTVPTDEWITAETAEERERCMDATGMTPEELEAEYPKEVR